MRCLSLWQPWASLLVAGVKRVETRGWPTAFRGPLLIHAAKHWRSDLAKLARTPPFLGALDALGVTWSHITGRGGNLPTPRLPFGAVVGLVTVEGCYRTEDVDFDFAGLDVDPAHPVWQYTPARLRLWPEPEKAFGDYSPGRFAFLCSNPERFADPIPCVGRQRFFDVPDELVPVEYRV